MRELSSAKNKLKIWYFTSNHEYELLSSDMIISVVDRICDHYDHAKTWFRKWLSKTDWKEKCI